MNAVVSKTQPISLSEINTCLTGVGMQPLAPEQAATLFKSQPRDLVIRGLRSAKTNQGALSWLRKVVATLGSGAGSNSPATSSEPSAAEPPADAPDEARSTESARTRNGRHVYAGAAALCFEADTTRSGVPTVSLDAALSTGPKTYDWPGKIRLQMTERELPCVLAVLLGYLPGCEFKNHGPNNDKGFSLERQTGKIFVRVFAKDQKLRAVPMDAWDTALVTALVIAQMKSAHPALDGAALRLMMDGVGRLSAANGK